MSDRFDLISVCTGGRYVCELVIFYVIYYSSCQHHNTETSVEN